MCFPGSHAIFSNMVTIMDNETARAEQYCGMRARDVFLENRNAFLERFAALVERGLASDIRVFGSVARGDDDEESDIDLLVSVPRITGRIHWDIAVELSGWLDFPVHVVLDDGHGLLSERILKEAVPLMEISGKEKPAKERDTEFLAECLEQVLDHASLARAISGVPESRCMRFPGVSGHSSRNASISSAGT